MENATNVHSSSYALLEQVTDTPWIGIQFLEHLPAGRDCTHSGPMRFCEAVRQASSGAVCLSPEMICCEGAKRAFGWTKDKDDALALELSEGIGMKLDRARELIRQVPALGHPYAGIRVGDCTNPDVRVTYVRPEAAMRLVRYWETAVGHSLRVDVSSIMAVCGNAVVKAYMSQSISISFGCPDSRQYGGIQPEEMVIAVPRGLLEHFGGSSRGLASPQENEGGSYADL